MKKKYFWGNMLGVSIIFLIFVAKILHIEILKNMKKLFVSALVLAMGTTAMAQQVDYSKMSVMLGSMVKERYAEIENTHRAPSSIDPLVMALVKANTEEVFARYGVKVMDSLDDLYIVVMKVSQMEQLSLDDDVVRIEANEANEPHMDRTPALIDPRPIPARGFWWVLLMLTLTMYIRCSAIQTVRRASSGHGTCTLVVEPQKATEASVRCTTHRRS